MRAERIHYQFHVIGRHATSEVIFSASQVSLDHARHDGILWMKLSSQNDFMIYNFILITLKLYAMFYSLALFTSAITIMIMLLTLR